MSRVFVIRPFGQKPDRAGKVIDFERVHSELIEPALAAAGKGFSGGTTGEIVEAGNIRADMFGLILEADLVVCDITIHNPNVFYELGVRHALRPRHTVMIKGQPSGDDTPFDLMTDRYVPYAVADPSGARGRLAEVIRASMDSDRPADSPVFELMPDLPVADVSRVYSAPPDLREINRASVAGRAGWLRLLATELVGTQFEWPGLRLVAKAQWDVEDFEAARASWEKVRDVYPTDTEANLALANIYERLHRRTGDETLITRSDQALLRVLEANPTREDRGEALGLKGRNRKTRWRLSIEGLATVEERREKGMNRDLIEAYEAYREAFFEDLNGFFPGLAALQLGTILLDLSGTVTWTDAFPNDVEASRYRDRLAVDLTALRHEVTGAVSAAKARLKVSGKQDVWVDISAADTLFLTEDKSGRVVRAYESAIPADHRFAANAAIGQLRLFKMIGVRTALADEVLASLRPTKGGPSALQYVVFVGHRVDEPGRPEARFPNTPAAVEKATSLIRLQLEGLVGRSRGWQALASAAPGADILFHELCSELGIPSTICLPMPADTFSAWTFGERDDWRSRFLQLKVARPILELSDRAELPHWLSNAKIDPWERGNRWVLEMARASGSTNVTLVALWDGKRGDRPGGTAHMVALAREAGDVDVRLIDARQLVA